MNVSPCGRAIGFLKHSEAEESHQKASFHQQSLLLLILIPNFA